MNIPHAEKNLPREERALQQKESREANLHEPCIWQQQPAVEQAA